MAPWVWQVGLALAIALLMIPVIMIGSMLIGIVRAFFEHRRWERNRVVREVPGLGEFWTWDGNLWYGEIDDVHICLRTNGQYPAPEQAAKVLDLLSRASELEKLGRDFLSRNEDCSWLEGGATGFELTGLDVEQCRAFSVEFGHPSDSDGTYTVDFDREAPVSSRRDD